MHEITLAQTIILWEGAVLYKAITHPLGPPKKGRRDVPTEQASDVRTYAQLSQLMPTGLAPRMEIKKADTLGPVERALFDDLMKADQRGS